SASYVAPTSVLPVIIGTALIKIGHGFIMGIITVSIADVIDYSDMKFGQRNESVITSTQTFLMKVAMAVAALLTGWGLEVFGYQPGQIQSEYTKNGLRFVMIALPINSVIVSYIIYRFSYNLKGAYLKDIVSVLSLR